MTFIAGNRLAYTKLLKLRPDQALDAQVVALEHGSDDRQIQCSRACVQAMRTDVGCPSSMGSMWNYGATYARRLKQRKNGSNALRPDEIRSCQRMDAFIVMLQRHNTSSRMLLLRTKVDLYMLQRSKNNDCRPPRPVTCRGHPCSLSISYPRSAATSSTVRPDPCQHPRRSHPASGRRSASIRPPWKRRSTPRRG
jgi:hypothetical protein